MKPHTYASNRENSHFSLFDQQKLWKEPTKTSLFLEVFLNQSFQNHLKIKVRLLISYSSKKKNGMIWLMQCQNVFLSLGATRGPLRIVARPRLLPQIKHKLPKYDFKLYFWYRILCPLKFRVHDIKKRKHEFFNSQI